MHLAADAAGTPFIANSSSHLARIGAKIMAIKNWS
jgi:hypothetical protein